MSKNLLPRVLVYTLGLSVLALGVACSVQAGLGISPVNSLPYVLSQMTPFSLGAWATAVYIVFILIQAVLKGRAFRVIDLTQILFSTLFGVLVDAAKALCAPLAPQHYAGRLMLLGVSVVLIAAGITLYLSARLVSMPAEGLAAAVAEKWGKPFGKAKMLVDCSVMGTSTLLALAFLGRPEGVREGTILSALLIGTLVVPMRKHMEPPLLRWLRLDR